MKTKEVFGGNTRLQNAARSAPPMFKGERGQAVAILQKAYVSLGYAMPASTRQDGSTDGIFGKETYSVTRQFQVDEGLSVDGDVGKQTLTALDRALSGDFPSVGPVPPTPPEPYDPKPSGPPNPNILRPVRPWLPRPKPPQKPAFAQSAPLVGFDGGVMPPWQMVPISDKPHSSGNGGVVVRLLNGDGLTVTSSNDAIKVHEVPISFERDKPSTRRFLLTGDVDGAKSMIEAHDGTTTVARLQAELTRAYELTADFFMVRDNTRKTSRAVSDLDKLVEEANELLAGQANIRIKKATVHADHKIDADLGPVILSEDARHQFRLFHGTTTTSDLRVFCVWETEETMAQHRAGDGFVGFEMGDGRILIEDDFDTGSATFRVGGSTLAHEVGHVLGLGHTPGTLMAEKSQAPWLRMGQIRKMWKNAKTLAA